MFVQRANLAVISAFFRVDLVSVERRTASAGCRADQSAFFAANQSAEQRARAGSDSYVDQIAVTTIKARFFNLLRRVCPVSVRTFGLCVGKSRQRDHHHRHHYKSCYYSFHCLLSPFNVFRRFLARPSSVIHIGNERAKKREGIFFNSLREIRRILSNS